MKTTYLLAGCLLVVMFAVMPAQAFTAKSLTVTLSADGDVHADFQYDMSFLEQTAVFFHIADPAAELKKAFDTNTRYPVSVPKATSSSATVIILSFATIYGAGSDATMVTPAVSFAQAEQVLNQYWFAPLLSPDFSPEVTTIIFPDGYQVTFNNVLAIPPVQHAMPG